MTYSIHQFPYVYWALLELVISVLCAGSIAMIDCPEVPCPRARKALSHRLSGTMFAMTSSETPCTSRRFLLLVEMRRTKSESGSPLRNFSHIAPERSARTFGTIANMLRMDAEILRASADDSPSPLVVVDRLDCARWWGTNAN